MDKLLKALSCIALLFALAGCAGSPLMTEVASQEIRPPAPDKVKIVFMRPSWTGGHFFAISLTSSTAS
jgi:hypothetical protein